MAEVLEPPVPIFASGGGTSIKSFTFHERMTSSSPPSIGGDSTRRKSFGMPSFLSRRVKNQPPPTLDSLALSEKLLAAESHASENLDPGLQRSIPSRREAEPMSLPPNTESNAANPQSQASQSIFRKLTTKFTRSRTRSTSLPPRENRRRSIALPKANNSTTLETRNAALRERGLLPPPPLSVQEAQQDKHVAIVTPPEPDQQSELDFRTTAANRIKEEWEARNRLTTFRFGGNSPAGSPVQEDFPAAGLDSVREVDTPLPSPQYPPSEFGDDDEPALRAPRAPPPTLNLSRGYHISPPLMQAWSDTPPDPYFLPLPPSPSSRSAAESDFSSLISAFAITPAADAAFTAMSLSFPLPPSPSFSIASFQTGTETPRVGGDSTPKPPHSPTDASMNSLAPPRPPRPVSSPLLDNSECESSLGVPSLIDSESSATVSTANSFASFARMRNVPETTVRNSITLEPLQAHQAISVVVETPGEERDAFVLTAFPVDAVEESKMAPPAVSEEPPRRSTSVEEPAPQPQPQPQVPPPRERRKSLSIFRRGKGEGGVSTITSIRNTLGIGRSKSTLGPRARFDPSHLPPSPTLPSGFATPPPQVRGRERPGAAGHKNRLSVSPPMLSPTMHNDGSILREMSLIENEESRRMTEVAFM